MKRLSEYFVSTLGIARKNKTIATPAAINGHCALIMLLPR